MSPRGVLPRSDRGAETATRAAGEADEPHSARRRARAIPRWSGEMPRPSGVGARSRVRGREQAAEARIPTPRFDEQRDVRATVERDLGASDRSHAERLRGVRELERAVDAVVIGERERLVPELCGTCREAPPAATPHPGRVRGMAVQLDVARHLSAGTWSRSVQARSSSRRKARRHAPRRPRAACGGRRTRRSRMGDDAASRARPTRRGAVPSSKASSRSGSRIACNE